MTHGALHVSAIALGVAAFVSISPIAQAEPYATSGATSAPDRTASSPTAASPSLSEPAPTPGWAQGGMPPAASGATEGQRAAHAYVRHHTHYASRSGHRYYGERNPVATAGAAVVGGVADLGAIAAYPIYCFPHYGSCRVYRPYP